jgi:hypothetical protein
MEEFRDELKKHADQSLELQAENSKLNDEVSNLKQRLVEQEHRHSKLMEDVRAQYVSEMVDAKESWREQAVKYGQHQRMIGREESVSRSYTNCNKTIEYGMKVNSAAASNATIICNALIASARFTVALIDFDVVDHHIAIVNTTNININLNGCYIVLEKCGDRFEITEDLVLEPRTKCSVWWASHNKDSEHSEPISHNIHLFRHCAPALALFWDRAHHNPEHPEHHRTSVCVSEVAQLFDSSQRRICQAVTNQAMFSVYYDYQIRDMSAHFTAEMRNGHRESLPDALNSSTLSEHARGHGLSHGHASPATAAKAKKAKKAGSGKDQPDVHSPLFPHVHFTRQNTQECIRFVEETDVLLMDYASDLLGRLDRFARRCAGNMQLCGFQEPGSKKKTHHHHHHHAAAAGDGSRPLPARSCGAALPPALRYNMSMCHVASRSIDVDELLAHNCITIENLSPAHGHTAGAAAGSPPVDLHPKCTVRLICNSNGGGSARQADSVSFQLERHVALAPGQRVVLVDRAAPSHPSHVLPVVGCGDVLERLRAMSAAMHEHCDTSAKRSRAAAALVDAPGSSSGSSSSSGGGSGQEDGEGEARTHNVQLGFLTLADQHDNLLFCAAVVQGVDISKTAFTANVTALDSFAESLGSVGVDAAAGRKRKRAVEDDEEEPEGGSQGGGRHRARDGPRSKEVHPSVMGRVSKFVSKIFG